MRAYEHEGLFDGGRQEDSAEAFETTMRRAEVRAQMADRCRQKVKRQQKKGKLAGPGGGRGGGRGAGGASLSKEQRAELDVRLARLVVGCGWVVGS